MYKVEVWVKWFKMRESLNLGYMALDLRDWVGLVVIERRGCGLIRGVKLKICGLYKKCYGNLLII